MPEGDTILRTAWTLHAALAGQTVRALRSSLPALSRRGRALVGQRVSGVEARGKNLLLRFAGGSVLRTHLRMAGSWHVYRPGEPWRKPARRARVVLETAGIHAVCFSAPVVELLSERQARCHPVLNGLGPDVLAPDLDMAGVLARVAARPELPLGEAITDQTLLAGVGNVYKSETLFLCGLDPFAPLGSVTADRLARMVRTARELMLRNLDGYPRRTRLSLTGPRLWVYGRAGKPCRRCGATVHMRRQGETARSTYFCPACQTAGERGTAASGEGAAGTRGTP